MAENSSKCGQQGKGRGHATKFSDTPSPIKVEQCPLSEIYFFERLPDDPRAIRAAEKEEELRRMGEAYLERVAVALASASSSSKTKPRLWW